ncbi:MAG: DUF86 domain-containing protein [Candidatus Vogelbacteria bacterium]|nr:DUF86 domain-containing protein [Candidatus Vogelbacteria bacterium]
MQTDEIKRKTDRLRAYLDELEPLLVLANEKILADQMIIRTIERLFQLVVDEAVDINTLILSDSPIESPESYRSTFYGLAEAKILERDFVDQISESAKLRNQVVHEYEKLKPVVLITKIKKQFPLFQQYLAMMIKKFVLKS